MVTPTTTSSGSNYTIKSGDTLSALAARNGTTVSELARLNNIPDPNKISAGANLKIPTVSPVVITSKTATEDLNKIKTDTGNINTGITNQAITTADQAKTDKAAADKAAADKLAADQKAKDQAQKDAALGIVSNPPAVTTAEKKLAKAEEDYQKVADDVSNTIKNIQNGTVPLSAGEKAQIAGLQAQLQVVIDQQRLANTGSEGLANIRGYQTGSAEYDPAFQAKTIGAIITGGLNKIVNLNIEMASAVAALTQSFKDNDIKAIKDAYTVYQDAAKMRIKTLDDVVTRTTTAVKDARDFAQKQLEFDLTSDKFTYQQKQDMIDNAFKAQQIDETERHNKATELVQLQANGTPGVGGLMPAVNLQGNGRPSATEQANFLSGLPQELATLVKGIANYDINPSAIPTRQYKGVGGLTQPQVLALVAQYDPTFSQSDYNVRQAYKKSLASNTSGSLGGAINSANKSTNHLVAFVNDMNKLADTGYSSANWALRNTLGQLPAFGRQTLISASTEGLGVADELAKFFKGTGVTDVQSIQDWKNRLSTSATDADVKGLVQGAVTLLAGQLETLSEQYQRTMGKPPDDLLIGESARANLSKLKNQGYTIDIPGVYYTNKDVYLKNGGSTDALTKARQRLIDANDPYNPATPENILELAQILNL